MLPTFIRLVLELSDEITTTKAIPSIKNNIFLFYRIVYKNIFINYE